MPAAACRPQGLDTKRGRGGLMQCDESRAPTSRKDDRSRCRTERSKEHGLQPGREDGLWQLADVALQHGGDVVHGKVGEVHLCRPRVEQRLESRLAVSGS